MKRIYTILLVLILPLGLFLALPTAEAAGAEATVPVAIETSTPAAPQSTVASGKCGDDLTWVLDSDGTLTISGTGAMYNWTSGNVPWDSSRNQIYAVVIENGVTSIGNFAFAHCGYLTSVEIPNGVTSICDYAFYICRGLPSVTIPDSVTSIGNYAFNCPSLTSVTMGSGVTSIGHMAFAHCSMTSVAIPSSVTSIGLGAFDGCSRLTGVYISDLSAWCGIDFIDYPEGVFPGAPGDPDFGTSNPLHYAHNLYLNGELVTDLTIPADVTRMGSRAFWGCSLTSVAFEGQAPEIGQNCFYRVTATVFYPAEDSTWTTSVRQNYGGTLTWAAWETTVGSGTCGNNLSWALDSAGTLAIFGTEATYDWAAGSAPWYARRTEIRALSIGGGVTGIGNSSFECCSNLTGVVIPGSVTSLGRDVFYGCSGMGSVQFNGQAPTIGQNCFYQVNATVFYPVEDNTWTAAKRINYGGTLTWVACGSGAVYINGGICGDNVTWALDDQGMMTIYGTGATYNWTSGNTPWYTRREEIQVLQIGNGVTGIGNSAFEDCSKLTSVVMPDSMTSIRDNAFLNCSGLTSVTLGSGVTDVGYCAFSRCSALTSVMIPASVTNLGRGVFSGCNRMVSVFFEGQAPETGQNCFYQVTATVFYPAANSSWTTAKRINYGGTLTWVACGTIVARGTCSDALYWLLDDQGTLAIYGTGATYDWASGKAPWYAWREEIQTLSIGNGVTGIGNSAFEGCSRLTGVIIPNSVTRIGDNAFLNCSRLTSVTLGSGVTGIGYCAFSRCSALTSVTIPASVTSLGRGTFSGCSGLMRVEFKGPAPEIGQNCFYQVTAPAWYPAAEGSWTAAKRINYGGTLTWMPWSSTAKNKWAQVDGKWYHFGANGYAQTGWQKLSDAWYYLGSDGVMRTGWQKISGVWYWFKDNGVMTTGWQKIGNVWYYFKDSGAMATGWQKVGSAWYYFKDGGAMVTGGQEIGGKWYFFNASGAMHTGWKQIDGKWYYFGSNGAMVTGWQQIGGKWYYFSSSFGGGGGVMQTGWLKDGNYWFYLQSSGAMAANMDLTIGGKTYHFNASGVCTNP